jgi:hypothetical protein
MNLMNDINVIVPQGMFGVDENDDLLDTVLRQIAKSHGDEEHNWVSKYGVDFENDIFMMHPYCWCEKEDCKWCGGCDCPREAFHYFVDGKEVSYEEQKDFFDRETFDKLKIPRNISLVGEKHNDWIRLAELTNKRRASKHDPVCDYCKGTGVFRDCEPGMGAPNFWYKPTNFRVYWYKYIGRDMKTNYPVTEKELIKILQNCII